MAKMNHKTVCGINGCNLNKVVEFLTGEPSVKYDYLEKDKTFEFLIKKEFAEEPESKAQIDYFVEFFKVKVKLV